MFVQNLSQQTSVLFVVTNNIQVCWVVTRKFDVNFLQVYSLPFEVSKLHVWHFKFVTSEKQVYISIWVRVCRRQHIISYKIIKVDIEKNFIKVTFCYFPTVPNRTSHRCTIDSINIFLLIIDRHLINLGYNPLFCSIGWIWKCWKCYNIEHLQFN